jgi:hypothetical protein
MSVVRLIVATRSSGPPASSKIIKELPGSVASGTSYICSYFNTEFVDINTVLFSLEMLSGVSVV